MLFFGPVWFALFATLCISVLTAVYPRSVLYTVLWLCFAISI